MYWGFRAVTHCLHATHTHTHTHTHTWGMRKIHSSIIFTWGERCWSEGAVHLNLSCQRGFSHLGYMEEWLFKENWFKGECYYIIYRDLYSRMWEWCINPVIFSIFLWKWCSNNVTSKFHDLLAFKYHKTIRFNDYHKGVFHPEKCFYLPDIILINVIKLHYLISTSKCKIHL